MKESKNSESQKFKWLASAILIAATLLVFSSAAGAAVFDITTEEDVSNPYDGVLSFREGLLMANISAGDDTIVLASGGNYQLTDCAVYGELNVTDDANLTIEGNGATITQICSDQRILNKKHDFSNDFILTFTTVRLSVCQP